MQPPTQNIGIYKKVYTPQGLTYQGLQPSDWANFCDYGTALAMQAQINAQSAQFKGLSINVVQVDNEESLGYLLLNPGNGVRVWMLQGPMADYTDPATNQPFVYWIDPVGSFADRQANPNPFLDMNPDSSLGGGAAGAAGAKMMMRNNGTKENPTWLLYWGNGTPWPDPTA